VVVVSGDVFDGQSKTQAMDLQVALVFFETLVNQLNSKELATSTLTRFDIIFVPGNHDLIRDELDQYKKYDNFITNFYGSVVPPKLTVIDKYNFICDYPTKKVAILGFNSCRIQVEQAKEKESEWVDDIDLSRFSPNEHEIKDTIKLSQAGHKNWDDFGYINPQEMDNVFTQMKRVIPSYNEYNLVATFHHHFYPFPENNSSKPDASVIRNYTDVLDQFQRFKLDWFSMDISTCQFRELLRTINFSTIQIQ